VPLGFVLGTAAGAVLSPRSATARRLTGAALAMYGGLVLSASARLAWQKRDPRLLAAMPLAFTGTHVVYGIASIWGIVDRRPANLPAPVDPAVLSPVEHSGHRHG
jgi:hypothetical protein